MYAAVDGKEALDRGLDDAQGGVVAGAGAAWWRGKW